MIYQNPQTQAIIEYAQTAYGDKLEFLWENSPKISVLRNSSNQKWYAIFFALSADKLGLDSSEETEIIDLRFPKGEALDFAESTPDVFPGYHMNKRSWITVRLGGEISTEQIISLLNQSYQLSLQGRPTKRAEKS